MNEVVNEKCPECACTEQRDLDCDECRKQGKQCTVTVCVECGATVYEGDA